jgi:hypothetical protein
MKKYIAFLTLLISSLTITGISFIDGKIWDVVLLVIGFIAYAIVGVLFSLGILSGKQNGKDAYALVFILLLLGAYAVYKGLVAFKAWVLGWSLVAKILVPIGIGILIGLVIVLMIIRKEKREE